MALVPRRHGKSRAIAVSERLYKRVAEWADREGYTLGSVIETAVEDFLDDRKDEEVRSAAPKVTGSAAAAGARGVK